MREVDKILLELYIDVREDWGDCKFDDTGWCYGHFLAVNITNPDRCPLWEAQEYLERAGYLENPQIIPNPEIGS